jgi:hypothetical protein
MTLIHEREGENLESFIPGARGTKEMYIMIMKNAHVQI